MCNLGNQPKIYVSSLSYYQYRKNEVLEKPTDPNCLILYKSNWNDFGYYTSFGAVYYNNTQLIDIGIIKICHLEMNDINNRVLDFIENKQADGNELYLDDKFCAIASGLDFYKKLNEYIPDSFDDILLKLREISVIDQESLHKFSISSVFCSSLLREISQSYYHLLTDVRFELNLDKKTSAYHILSEFEKYQEDIAKKQKLTDQFYDFFNVEYYKYEISLLILSFVVKYTLKDERWIELLNKIKDEHADKTEFVKNIDKFLGENEDIYKIIKNIHEKLTVSLDDISADNNKLKLGHYTSINTLEHLNSKKDTYLRLTNSKQLNDPMEGKVLLEYLFGDDSEQEFIESHIYLASATTELDSLPMWKQYTDNVDGISLRFTNDYLRRLVESKYLSIVKICYIALDENKNLVVDDDDNDIKKWLSELKKEVEKTDPSSRITALDSISYLFKKREYSYEKEYRFILNLENPEEKRDIILNKKPGMPLPFLYVMLDEINLAYDQLILGPKAIDIDYVGPYIKHCDKEINILRSSISFR